MSEAAEIEVYSLPVANAEPAPEVTEEPVAATEEQNAEPAENEESPPSDEQPKPEADEGQKRSKWQRRIDRKNEEIARHAAEAEQLRQRLNALKQQRSPTPKLEDALRLDQFDSWDDYQQAQIAYAAKVALDELRKEFIDAQQAEQERKAREAEFATVQLWNDRKQAAAEKYADFEEVLGDSDAPMTNEMRQAILESEQGADVAYWLAKNPAKAKEIASLSPGRQIAAIGRIEAEINAPKPKAVTQAPPPITPAGSKAKADKEPHEMSPSEFAAWRKRVIAARR